MTACSLSDMVVLGRVSGFGPWPPSPRYPQRWLILWRERWMSASPPMCTWWRGCRRKQVTSWQVWRRKGWSRGFPNMRTGKGFKCFAEIHIFDGVLPLGPWVLISSCPDSCSVSQLAGPNRPKRRGPGGKQDCDCDQEPEGHHPHPCWRGEEPAGQLDERVRLAESQRGAFPRLHGRYIVGGKVNVCP